MVRCRLWSALLVALLVPLAVRADQERPWRPVLTPEFLKAAQRTDWYGAYVQNKKMGYIKTALERLGEKDNPVYRVTLLLRVIGQSAGQRLDLEQLQEEDFEGRPPYRLLRARSRARAGEAVQESVLRRTAKGFRLVIRSKGQETIKEAPPLDLTLADVLAADVWLRSHPPVGAKVLTQDLNLDDMRLDRERRTLLATKKALVRGVPMIYHEVESLSLRHKIKALERYDEQGVLLSGRIGGAFEMRLEPEAQAKNVEGGADLFLLGLVKIDRPLGDSRTITRLIVQVQGKEAPALPTGPGQQLERDAAGRLLLKLGKGFGRPRKATPEEIKDNLAATVSYPADNAKIQALARQAIGKARTDREKVRCLVHFVHQYVQPSYRNKGLIVLDLLEKKEGDCTAYAALLTTLARAAGIPCREVSGLLYVGDSQKAFGAHAWNEVVLDGRWTPVDASCNEPELDAAHICFGAGETGGLNLLQSYGNLSLRLIEVRHQEKKQLQQSIP
jgi:hypothetical protein